GGVGGIGEALVVEVVDQAHEAPAVGGLAGPVGHGPHRQLDGIHVPAQRLGGGVLVDEGEGGGASERQGSSTKGQGSEVEGQRWCGRAGAGRPRAATREGRGAGGGAAGPLSAGRAPGWWCCTSG